MGVTVGVNGMSVVHADSGGSVKIFPDICNTPSPSGITPISYTNSASSSDTASATSTVTCDGNPICHEDSNFSTSTGDESGIEGGTVSGTFTDKATFVNHSFDVQVEGKGVARALDMMLLNDENTLPSPLAQGPVVVSDTVEKVKNKCVICDEEFE
jgi:hypothetical protein